MENQDSQRGQEPDAAKVVVAIDGPAGAGKSTVARMLAGRLGVPYIDTGAMYRAVGVLAMREGMSPPFGEAERRRLEALAREHRIELEPGPDGVRVRVDGEDVSETIRSPEAAAMASAVSAVPGVRRALVPLQRAMAAAHGGVLEGRDIGTVVFPDADLKVFLTAAPEVRARRRLADLQGRGVETTLEAVLAEQEERDLRDTTREDSPLMVAPGALVIDSSELEPGAVVDRIVAHLGRFRRNRLTDGMGRP